MKAKASKESNATAISGTILSIRHSYKYIDIDFFSLSLSRPLPSNIQFYSFIHLYIVCTVQRIYTTAIALLVYVDPLPYNNKFLARKSF